MHFELEGGVSHTKVIGHRLELQFGNVGLCHNLTDADSLACIHNTIAIGIQIQLSLYWQGGDLHLRQGIAGVHIRKIKIRNRKNLVDILRCGDGIIIRCWYVVGGADGQGEGVGHRAAVAVVGSHHKGAHPLRRNRRIATEGARARRERQPRGQCASVVGGRVGQRVAVSVRESVHGKGESLAA